MWNGKPELISSFVAHFNDFIGDDNKKRKENIEQLMVIFNDRDQFSNISRALDLLGRFSMRCGIAISTR